MTDMAACELYTFTATYESTVHDLFQHHMTHYFPEHPHDFVFLIDQNLFRDHRDNTLLSKFQCNEIKVLHNTGFLEIFLNHDHERGKLEDCADLYEIKSLILNTVMQKPAAFVHVSDNLKNDDQVVMAVAQKSGIRYLKYAGKECRKDTKVMNAAEEALKAKYRRRMVRLIIRPFLGATVRKIKDIYKEVLCSETTFINMI
jgi:hypothetical protein